MNLSSVEILLLFSLILHQFDLFDKRLRISANETQITQKIGVNSGILSKIWCNLFVPYCPSVERRGTILRFVSDSVVDFDIILPVSVPLVAWTVGQVLWHNTGMKI